MNDYVLGTIVLGAAPSMPIELTPAQQAQAEDTLIFATRAGAVLGLVGGALLWSSHRVIGALLGGLVIGPAVGVTLGVVAVGKSLKRLKETM